MSYGETNIADIMRAWLETATQLLPDRKSFAMARFDRTIRTREMRLV
jgi:hypothetical protein